MGKTERSLQTCHASYTFSCTSALGHCLRPCAGLGRPSVWFNMSFFFSNVAECRLMMLFLEPKDNKPVGFHSIFGCSGPWLCSLHPQMLCPAIYLSEVTSWETIASLSYNRTNKTNDWVLVASQASRKHSVHHVVWDISVLNTANFLISTCSL